MSEEDCIIITSDETGLRIDRVLAQRYGQKSRTYFQYLIKEKKVLLNDCPVKKKEKVKEKDEISIFFIATPEISLEAENIPLDILFEDEHLIVINKPANLVVHPAQGNWKSTLVNGLIYHCKNLKGQNADNLRPGIVHRLDKDTTGIIITVKTEMAHQKMIQMFSERKIEKTYLALCIGKLDDTTLSAPIARHPVNRKEMAVLEKGKEAITKFTKLSSNNGFSLVMAKPSTGRTHQIRVHLKHLQAPVLGDIIYGNKKINDKYQILTQQLHAYQIKFNHPITDEKMHFQAPLPEIMKKFLEKFELNM